MPGQTPIVAQPCVSMTPAQPSVHPLPAQPSRVTLPPIGQYAYAWADSQEDPFAGGATFALVRGISPRGALRILAPHALTPIESPGVAQRWVDAHQTDDYAHDPELIEAGSRNGWTMVLGGNRATDHGVLRRLSRAGAAVVIFVDVEDLASFQYAKAGHLVRQLDPLGSGGDTPSIGPHLPQEHGIGFGHHDSARFVSQSVHLASRLIGFPLVPADLTPQRYDVAVAAVP